MARKIKILIILGLLGFIGLLWWLVSSREGAVATVFVTADNQAVVWLSHNDEDFQEMGQSPVTFTSSVEGVLEVRAVDGRLKSQTAVRLTLGHTQKVHLGFQKPKAASHYAPGPVRYPLIAENFVYGLSPSTFNITVKQRQSDILPDLVFLNIPKVISLSWYDEHNFVYGSLGRKTVGLVVDDDLLVLDKSYSDFATKDRQIFLLSQDEVSRLIFGKDEPVEVLWVLGEARPVGQIFASEQYLYIPVHGSHVPSDSHSHEILVNKYSHRGQLLVSLEFPGAHIYNLAEVDNTIFVATFQGVIVIDTDINQRLLPLELTEPVVDILEKDGLIYVLTLESGLWQLDSNNLQAGYQLLVTQPPSQTSVENSLVIKDNRLYFSSKTKPEALETATLAELSSVYYIELDSD